VKTLIEIGTVVACAIVFSLLIEWLVFPDVPDKDVPPDDSEDPK
jgi:hypothetical protein